MFPPGPRPRPHNPKIRYFGNFAKGSLLMTCSIRSPDRRRGQGISFPIPFKIMPTKIHNRPSIFGDWNVIQSLLLRPCAALISTGRSSSAEDYRSERRRCRLGRIRRRRHNLQRTMLAESPRDYVHFGRGWRDPNRGRAREFVKWNSGSPWLLVGTSPESVAGGLASGSVPGCSLIW